MSTHFGKPNPKDTTYTVVSYMCQNCQSSQPERRIDRGHISNVRLLCLTTYCRMCCFAVNAAIMSYLQPAFRGLQYIQSLATNLRRHHHHLSAIRTT